MLFIFVVVTICVIVAEGIEAGRRFQDFYNGPRFQPRGRISPAILPTGLAEPMLRDS